MQSKLAHKGFLELKTKNKVLLELVKLFKTISCLSTLNKLGQLQINQNPICVYHLEI